MTNNNSIPAPALRRDLPYTRSLARNAGTIAPLRTESSRAPKSLASKINAMRDASAALIKR